ncbi:MAG: hypothetical protein WA210_17365 [Burkholderiaceae bacterium]
MSDNQDAADSDLGPQQPAAEPASTQRLLQALGPRELRCALLALLLPKRSDRALASWLNEIETTQHTMQLRAEAMALAGAARLPWFELLLGRMAGQPRAERQALLESTRRVVSARGAVQPLDTLHWLAMRRRLGEKPPASARSGAESGFSKLSETDVYAIARYSAFLSRMIPAHAPDGAAGAAWYASVMQRWVSRIDVPTQFPLPDTDAVVRALHRVASLPLMQRPVLMRDWVSAALRHSAPAGLADLSADALRLSCTLLDTPVPAELAKHYIEPST